MEITSATIWIEDDMIDASVKPQIEKPPYSVPSMAEIAALPRNGYRVVSTFSGCGGSCLGFEMAGFEVLWASEFVEAARDTYRLNHPGVPVDDRDIRQVTAEEILERTGLQRGELDVLEGSPPCANFSTAGERAASWGKVKAYSDTQQRSDDLFFEFVRILDGLQPRVFVAENVSGLVKGVAKGYFIEILAAMKTCGYRVAARLLDAQWLSVPQMRQRIIFVGVRNDLGVEPSHPKPLGYRYSVRDAIPWIVRVDGRTGPHFERTESEIDEPMNSIVVNDPAQTRYEVEAIATKNDERSIDEPAPIVQTHERKGTESELTVIEQIVGVETRNGKFQSSASIPARTIRASAVGRSSTSLEIDSGYVEVEVRKVAHGDSVADNVAPTLDGYAIGTEWEKLRAGQTSDKYINLSRPNQNRPSPTVTAEGGNVGAAAVTHPTEKRKFTIAELRRICAFPDDFVLTGTYAQQWERLGRAVPPLMMRAVAETVRDEILRKLDDRS